MLSTEMRNPKTTHLDKMSTMEMLQIIHEENVNAANAVGAALDSIAKAVDAISAAIANGGRLIYIGAGTSGRLGVIDATECPPTYGVSPETVVGVMAGGRDAMFRSSENKEDTSTSIEDLQAIDLCGKDVLVGISAAGGAAYVITALEYAKSLGCTTVSLTSNPGTPLTQVADISIVTETGPEVVTGSTRMKAGTAQKLVLNMLSTCAMVKNGHVYENMMINLRPTNIKLQARMVRIVSEILSIGEPEAEALLEKSDWNIRKAVSK